MKRFHKLPWFDAHFAALLSVTPRHGKAFFSKCNIPACHIYDNIVVDDEEGINAAIVYLIAIKFAADIFDNTIVLLILLLKFKKYHICVYLFILNNSSNVV